MAVSHKLYGPSLKNVADGNVNLNSNTIKVYLMTSAHSFTQDNQYWATVSANQTSSGTDYAAKDLVGQATTYTDKVTTLTTSSETQFCSSGSIKAFHAVLAASSYLISSVNFDGAQESVDGEFKIIWTNKKVLTMTVSA